ncbi:MAG: hypothetical protein WBH31_16440 [Promethearchaeia archaeon]
MVVSKEKFIEWELNRCDLAKENILKENYKPVEIVQEKQELKKSYLRKVAEMIKARNSLVYAIIVNTLILTGSIVVISLFIVIGGLLMDPFLILSILLVILLFTVMEVFKLVEKETRCKNSR